MLTLLAAALFRPQVLTVGESKAYPTIEAAVAAAHESDRIEVYPWAGHYGQTAIKVKVANLTIVGKGTVIVDGNGFEYSGVGPIPRAIFQIEAPDATIENLSLINAHNASFNGAGIRVLGSNRATIRHCDIAENDMGIMSSGESFDQLYEDCDIHHNGNDKDPGYNHNLYLGGETATVSKCRISGATTGHDLKSRTHFLLVQYCTILGASNRELDIVEAEETVKPNSNAVLIGNLIIKDDNCKGNREVIHFGQEKGTRNGSLYAIGNTIITPFASPVFAMDTADAVVTNCLIYNGEQSAPTLFSGPGLHSGSNNWISQAYSGTRANLTNTVFKKSPSLPAASDVPAPIAANYVDGDGKIVKAVIRKEWLPVFPQRSE